MKRKLIFVQAVLLFLSVIAIFPLAAQEAEVELKVSPRNLEPGDTAVLSATFSIPDGMYMALQEQFFFVDIDGADWLEAGDIEYPDGEEKNGLTIYKDEVTITRPIRVKEDAEIGVHDVTVITGHQFCNEEGVCFIPRENSHGLQVRVGEPGGGGAVSSAGADRPDFLQLLQFILFAFIGGILLNVMPCVLPLLSVRALSLVNQGGEDRKKIFAGSMAYTAGILLSFLILATVVTILKISGELIGWGFQFQNPGFVIVLISIIFVFALSMFDVFVISAPGTATAAKASGRGGYLGSFFTGIFAVIVATPCTAPFLGAALGFAFSQPPAVIFLIFVFVGLGLALPFILLGIWPKLIQKIPKPGNWMNIFKEIMGFLLIGTVIYLLTTLFRQLSGTNFIRMIIFLGILAFASWLYGRFAKPGSPRLRGWLVFFLAAAIITLGAVFVVQIDGTGETPGAAGAETEEEVYISSDWEVFSPEKVERYRAEGKPVFISFHAAWCTNCKVNEATVLSKEEILAAFREHGVVLLHGDYTNRDETIARWIQRFDRAGVPVYALYVPEEEEPILFPELISKNMIFSALEENLR